MKTCFRARLEQSLEFRGREDAVQKGRNLRRKDTWDGILVFGGGFLCR